AVIMIMPGDMKLIKHGTVHDIYRDGDEIVFVASDRVAIFGRTLPTLITGKGIIQTSISLWWFRQLNDIIANHVISAENVPAQYRGRALRCRYLRMIPYELVARGYLAGSALEEYRASGSVSGVKLGPR